MNECDDEVSKICNLYKERRDELCKGLNRIGWNIESPNATMFLWAKIPEKFQKIGSLEFSKLLIS